MHLITRYLESKVNDSLFKWKIIIIYWARQVGKTTLVKKILLENKWIYLNCDEFDVKSSLENKTSTELLNVIWNNKLIIIDEAQRVNNIGLTLKLLHDTYPDIQIIATGSSSFDLSNKINEPLTWRKKVFNMYPISFSEYTNWLSKLESCRLFENRVIYGMYPDIIFSEKEDTIDNLKTLADSYLFKDILNFWKIKKSDFLIKLLQCLALQIWSEVSYNELSRILGIDKKTVEAYIEILEQAFIIFRLSSFNRNIRSELKRSKKIYFFDTGLRNALINNYNPFHLRNDVWDLFENFLISERIKLNSELWLNKNIFFWRTVTQKEIDFVEEYGWEIHGYEFKWNSKKYKKHKDFLENYDKSSISLINKENVIEFIK